MALRGIATSAIDLSDGLLGDLGHVLAASGAGGCIDTSIASGLMACAGAALDAAVTREARLACILAGGDDYELAFTAPPGARDAVQNAGQTSATRVTRIGQIETGAGLRLVDAHGAQMPNRYQSFDHFS